MSLSTAEILNISVPILPPGVSSLVRKRLTELGFGQTVNRAVLQKVCGTESAANQFLHNAMKDGFIVPVSWGTHQVVDKDTCEVMMHLANPIFRRFISWVRVLPQRSPRELLFWAPPLWRTQLNFTHPIPVVALTKGESVAKGTPPQWEAFQADIIKKDRWTIEVNGDRVANLRSPGVVDTIVLLRAALNERWRAAAGELEDGLSSADTNVARDLLPKVNPPMPAPTGRRTLLIGTGPPFRYRLLAPRWYMDVVGSGIKRHAFGEALIAA